MGYNCLKNEVMAMDVIIFAGQSNMVGVTESMPKDNEPVSGAREYRYRDNSFVPLSHPVGEDLFDMAIQGSASGFGSLVPAFCREYIARTGKDVIAIHTAKGGSNLSQWLQGSLTFYAAKTKITAALKKIREEYEIDRLYFVWLQGESDALCRNTKEE